MLLEVCLANPDATRKGDVIKELEQEVPNPMPGYMCDIIMASWDVKTYRTLLESSLSSAALEFEVATRQMMNLFLADTNQNVNYKDSIIYLLENLNSIEAVYDLTDIYAGMGEFEVVYNKLYDLLERKLSDNEENEVRTMIKWYEFTEDYFAKDNNVDTLSSDDVKTLIEFAATETKAGHRAKSMLYHYSGGTYNYHIEPEFSEEMPMPKKFILNPQDVLNEFYNKVSVYPNPAEFYTTFMYDLHPDVKSSFLQISDSKGTVIVTAQLSGNLGHYLWDTRNVPSGFYTYTILHEGKKLNSGKVMVKK